MAIAKSNNEVIGSLTLTNKKIIFNKVMINAYEIGDSYIKKNHLRNFIPKNKINGNKYINESIFGRMVYELIKQVPQKFNNLWYS